MTPRQREVYELYTEVQNYREVGRQLGIAESAVRGHVKKAKKHIHMDPGILEAMDRAGLENLDHLHSGWLKTDKHSLYFMVPRDEQEKQDIFDSFREALHDCPTSLPRTGVDTSYEYNTLTRYILTDLHMGMLAWEQEAGEDYDINIASDRLNEAMGKLVQSTPNSEEALVLNLGDMFHANDYKSRTPQSGHVLDSDGRFTKVIHETVKTVVATIETLKQKHKKVSYVGISGNHDPDANQFLTVAIMMRYADDPDVDVIFNPAKLYVKQFGKCLIGAHHGDMRAKPERLVMQLADDNAEEWGGTYWRYLDTGHIHHDSSKDIGGVFWESHRTLASRDAYATGSGYTTRKTLKAITVHREHGEVSRHTVGVIKDMVRTYRR